ncbi:nSTAND1 domain-containing NTPase [Mycolicibacterium vinylchloridicum]|uniref:nSTAND1 domain-containing NTPase n=1 Tax=Mycolicibacterium vinylchloridicum TaxID=2736928 RepID=UPI0015C6A150|nr:hypothetical protein [Mycolicibacterium vinylchloridicum]
MTEQRPELAGEIFLDIDTDTGLRLSEHWDAQLVTSNSRCEYLICLMSRNWAASRECPVEYRTAEGFGKRILVARIEDAGDGDITSRWQRCDLFADGNKTEIAIDAGPPVLFNTAALDQVKKAIEGSGVSPEHFKWPPAEDPGRAPYRGWDPFEDIDAGVFFGRDAEIARGLDELRSMRDRLRAQFAGRKSLFVVLGPSGSGKSSFLRAGLIPRLQRDDRNFVVLGLVRPGRNALIGERGLAAAIQSARSALKLPGTPPLGEIKRICRDGDAERVYDLLMEIRAAAIARLAENVLPTKPDAAGVVPARELVGPTLVLPLDQAEELFSANAVSTDAAHEAERFLALLAAVIARANTHEVRLMVAASIRTDCYESMQNHPALTDIEKVVFSELKTIPPHQFPIAIRGPAKRATEAGHQLTIADDLVDRLIADAGDGADTLPLLALTLNRLYTDYGTAQTITVADYESMGGMRDVVDNQIEQILPTAPHERDAALALLRSAFIPWLASINPDSDQPMRRVALLSELPSESERLINALVEKRLLQRDHRDGQPVVEVALESLLRQWDQLADWLQEERHNLVAAAELERAARAWDKNDRKPGWLLEGDRLSAAESLIAASGFAEFAEQIANARQFLAASRAREDAKIAREQEMQRAEHQRFCDVVAGQLLAESAAMLAGKAPGGDVRAFQQLLVAHGLSSEPDDKPILDALAARAQILKLIETGSCVRSVAFSPDGHSLATAGADGSVRVWDSASGRSVADPFVGHTGFVFGVAFSPDGRRLASAGADGSVRVWDSASGRSVADPFVGHTGFVFGVAFSPDGRRLASAGADGSVRVWDSAVGQPLNRDLPGHNAAVSNVAFSPDGHRLASAGWDATVRLWDVQTGDAVGDPFIGHVGIVCSVMFSPDGRVLASAGRDATVRLWDVQTGQPIGEPMVGHDGWVRSVAFSPDGRVVASAGRDATVRLWDVETGQPLAEPVVGHAGEVNCVAFSPDGQHLASVGDDGTARLLDARIRQPFGEPLAADAGVVSVAFSPDGQSLTAATCDAAGRNPAIRMWDAHTGQHACDVNLRLPDEPAHVWDAASTDDEIAQHLREVTFVEFSPDGERLATAAEHTIRMWDARTGRPIGDPLTAQSDLIYELAFSPDGRRLAAASSSDTIVIWDVDSGQPVGEPLSGHLGELGSIAFSPDGRYLASGGEDGTVRLWNGHTGEPVGEPLSGHTDMVWSVAFSPDGLRLASASRDATVRLWDVGTGHPLSEPLVGHTNWVRTVGFSPDGRKIASGSLDGTVRLWDADTGQALGEPLVGHTNWVRSVAFSPDGRRLASAARDQTVRFWDVQTGEPVGDPLTCGNGWMFNISFSSDGRHLVGASGNSLGVGHTAVILMDVHSHDISNSVAGHTGMIRTVAFSPDGRLFASGGDDAQLRLWDAETGLLIGAPLMGHYGAVWSVAFSADGLLIASAGGDETVRLWDARTGQPVGEPLTGHQGWVRTVAFSPDGQLLASAGDDETVRLWDAHTGQPVGEPLAGHTGEVSCVAFSPDGLRLASASWDQTVRRWDTRTGLPLGEPITGHGSEVHCVTFSPDGERLAIGTDESLSLWNSETGQRISDPSVEDRALAVEVAFSPDGQTLVSASWTKGARRWDPQTGAPLSDPTESDSFVVTCVAFSPDGKRFALGSATMGSPAPTVRLWDANTGTLLAGAGDTVDDDRDAEDCMAFSLDGKRLAVGGLASVTTQVWDLDADSVVGAPVSALSGPITSVALSPNGRRLVTATAQTMQVWDARTGLAVGEPLVESIGRVDCMALSPDGHRIAAACEGVLRLWDIRTGLPSGEPLTGHISPIRAVTFSPDGRLVASAGWDEVIRLWDTDTGQPFGPPLAGHTNAVSALSFSPDGRLLASGSDDNTVQLWDIRTGAPVRNPLTGHRGEVTTVVFSPDGRTVASGDANHDVRLWQVSTPSEELATKLTAGISEQDWREWVSPDIDYLYSCPKELNRNGVGRNARARTSSEGAGSWMTWLPADHEQSTDLLARLASATPHIFGGARLLSSRWSQLSFYEAHRIVELELARDDDVVATIFVLDGPNGPLWLNGDSAPIHEINEAESLMLTDSAVADYIRFFFFFLRADDGAFVIVESGDEIQPGDILVDGPGDVLTLEEARQKARPMVNHGRDATNRWEARLTVAYFGELFRVSISVTTGGFVQMGRDEPIGELGNLVIPGYPPLGLAARPS